MFFNYSFFLALFLFIIASSCTKKPTLSPKNNTSLIGVSYTDTFSFTSETYKVDSISTKEVSKSLLGIYNDPIFGITSAGFAISPLLSSSNVNFGTNSTFDSLVITLNNYEFYGDSSATLKINVYELDQKLDENTTYYSNHIPKYKSLLLASVDLKIARTDSMKVSPDTTLKPPHVRIRLNKPFGEKIFNLSGTSTLADNTTFTDYLHGFYITTNQTVKNNTLASNQGVISSFDTDFGEQTAMILYYNDSLTYKFLINKSSKNYNVFDHNYTNTDIEKKLNKLTNDNSITYLQPLSGVATKIFITHFKNLKNYGKNIIINKAEFIFPIKNSSDAIYKPSESIIFSKIDSTTNKITFIKDFSEGKTHYGGVFEKAQKKSYKMNVTLELQSILLDSKRDPFLYLNPLGRAVKSNRTIINTNQHTTSPSKLIIKYSKI